MFTIKSFNYLNSMRLMENKVGIINLQLGNVKSVYNTLEYLNETYICKKILRFKKVNSIILPGVGTTIMVLN